jgi:hypothetical protein
MREIQTIKASDGGRTVEGEPSYSRQIRLNRSERAITPGK